MLDETKKFYERVMLKKGDAKLEYNQEPPTTWTKIFYKEYPRFDQIYLQEPIKCRNIDDVLAKRKSEREYSREPINFRELSTILNSCKIIEEDSERRTYPSAGARYPVEIYSIVFNTCSLERGAYHYNIRKNSLEFLWKKDLKNISEQIVSPFVSNPSAAIVLTSVIARSEVKYGTKAYPFSLIEAGHIGQNITLTAASLDIGSCPVGGFIDETLSEILDLTEDEIPIYVISLGKLRKKDANNRISR